MPYATVRSDKQHITTSFQVMLSQYLWNETRIVMNKTIIECRQSKHIYLVLVYDLMLYNYMSITFPQLLIKVGVSDRRIVYWG